VPEAPDPERPRRESAARRRLLDTATRLFYAHGVHAVGIDRIIADADVAKASFYKHFPSKEDLVLAYVREQDELGRAAVASLPDQPPRQMLLTLFDRIDEAARQPGYRGCPFLNAAAEYPDPASPVRQAIDEHRRWVRDGFKELLVAEGHPDPDNSAEILVALNDGLLIASHLDQPTDLSSFIHAAIGRAVDAVPPTAPPPAP
jgi:AcrR family transcriptional regulator